MLADAHWPGVAYGVRVTNLNPADTIGASAWLVETDGHRILLDAGSSPGVEGRAGLPLYSQVEDQDVDAIAISHCHQDHCGSLDQLRRSMHRNSDGIPLTVCPARAGSCAKHVAMWTCSPPLHEQSSQA